MMNILIFLPNINIYSSPSPVPTNIMQISNKYQGNYSSWNIETSAQLSGSVNSYVISTLLSTGLYVVLVLFRVRSVWNMNISCRMWPMWWRWWRWCLIIRRRHALWHCRGKWDPRDLTWDIIKIDKHSHFHHQPSLCCKRVLMTFSHCQHNILPSVHQEVVVVVVVVVGRPV